MKNWMNILSILKTKFFIEKIENILDLMSYINYNMDIRVKLDIHNRYEHSKESIEEIFILTKSCLGSLPASDERRFRSMNENKEHEDMVECHYNGASIYVPKKKFADMLFELEAGGSDFVRFKEGAKLFKMSERSFHDLAEAADAIYHFRGIALINVNDIKEYLKYCK